MGSRKINKRTFLKQSAITVSGLAILPSLNFSGFDVPETLLKRRLGKTNREVTTFGLGGQASIQWTPDDVDPVAIILKAFKLGINYFDTSNLYGPSQMNYGKAFRQLDLIPGNSAYNEKLRKSIFLTSKTHLRYAKGNLDIPGLNNWTNGEQGSHTIDDIKRTLSQVFGDGNGNYPKGAYLDMVLLHSITSQPDVDAVLEGLDNPDPKAKQIGALAALLDYRDGTNKTGLNPKEEKLIKHLGFSGHWNAGVMMQLIRRDHQNILDGMLVAINANDKLNLNMQNNVIPVAKAKDMGVIGMKTFADGAMYTKEATWSNNPSHVVRKVGSPEMSYSDLIQYSLTTPGVDTLIIGIGQISDNPEECQLTKNIAAAQIKPNGLSHAQRASIEKIAAKVKDGKTNYFQEAKGGLTAAQNIITEKIESNKIILSWDTAYAGDDPINLYKIFKNDELVGEVVHSPQISEKKFSLVDVLNPDSKSVYKIVTVDKAKNWVSSELISI
ncbi:MAG: aldo/keto reductase [Bacteroidales bacterium]|nr:aldo/keto reductase [Bacteroidales bacterium]MBN2818857.1 aldo/keto reductase [Bacteroidales bacterium]